MANGNCNNFWETPDGSLASEAASIYVRSTTELKCFQVAHPLGSKSQYTTDKFNVYNLTAATTLEDFNAGGGLIYEEVNADDSLCAEPQNDDLADDIGGSDDPYQPSDDYADDIGGGKSDGGLTGGEIGGIVGASVGGVVIVGAIVFYVKKSRKGRPNMTTFISSDPD